jgi:hypothetical protein
MVKHVGKHKLGIKLRRAWDTGKYSKCLVQFFIGERPDPLL